MFEPNANYIYLQNVHEYPKFTYRFQITKHFLVMMQIYVSKCEAGPTFPSEVEAYGSEKGQLTVDDITNVLKKLGRKMRKDRCGTMWLCLKDHMPPSLLRWETCQPVDFEARHFRAKT